MTDAAPSRCELPTQSAPVSPPPITITCLPAARDRRGSGAGSPADAAVALVEVLHREVDAVELAARHRQVARNARAGRDDDRVELLAQLVARRRRRRRRRRSGSRRPRRASCSTRRSTTHFSILKSGTPKRTSPPAASSRSNTRDRVAGAVQLLRARRGPPGPKPTTATVLPVRAARRLRHDPALVPRAVDDRDLDLLDRDRVALVDLEHARRLARRRAEPPGELGEVVRRGAAGRSPRASGRGRRGRSSPGSGCRAGSRCGRTGRRTPCSARPAPQLDDAAACSTNSLEVARRAPRVALGGRRRWISRKPPSSPIYAASSDSVVTKPAPPSRPRARLALGLDAARRARACSRAASP